MKLPLRPSSQPWFHEGLSFTCTQCGNCCTGPPGYVWISTTEVQRLSAHLGLSVPETVRRYCRRIGNRLSLKEHRNFRGEYDCVFLREDPLPDGTLSRTEPGRRTCSIYPVRPLQCRTWPFWDGNLASPTAWERVGATCPGLNRGKRYPLPQIIALRDATDWPQQSPGSEE